MAELAPLLAKEDDHAYLCHMGIWYWECTHKQLAVACYLRSIELKADSKTYFNLAACLDDIASEFDDAKTRESYRNSAVEALKSCLKLADSIEERDSIKNMLLQNGKKRLWARARKTG